MTDPNEVLADGERQMLRHALATLAYRGGKTLRDAPDDFGQMKAAQGSRTSVEIVAHIGDLFEWALSIARGEQVWAPKEPAAWTSECDRFFETVTKLDDHLASNRIRSSTAQRLFQGPVADAFTHVGQLALMRRLAGSPVRAENYAKARITIGRTGPDQASPAMEFD